MADLIIEKFISGPNFTNCYLVHNTKNLWIIDPPQIDDKISEYISTNKLKPTKIINTHGHIDHIYANHHYKKLYDIPLAIHKDDVFLLEFDWSTFSTSYPPNYQSIKPDILLSDKSKLNLDDFQFIVIHTPGHSPGSICLKYQDILFSGDTLFKNSIGRYDLPGGSENQIMDSLQKLLVLPDNTQVLPGHGEETTIGWEKKNNPFLINI